MPETHYLIAICTECEEDTTVVQVYWPATRYDPPDGEMRPEECEHCGKPFDDNTHWTVDEPPDSY